MSSEAFFTAFISISLTVLLMLLLGGREQSIRDRFSATKNSWLRSIYIKIFIDVVRGRDRASQARYAHGSWIIISTALIVFSLIFLVYTTGVNDRIDNLLQAAEHLRDLKGDNDTDQTKESAITELTHLKIEGPLLWSAYFNIFAYGIFFLLTLIRHRTIIPFRAQFSFELDRFMNRIQALASKRELAELVELEASVNDVNSAKLYVKHIKAIARRHEVEALVQNFLLWDKYDGEREES